MSINDVDKTKILQSKSMRGVAVYMQDLCVLRSLYEQLIYICDLAAKTDFSHRLKFPK